MSQKGIRHEVDGDDGSYIDISETRDASKESTSHRLLDLLFNTRMRRTAELHDKVFGII
jgi:hypothetical protein